MPNIVRISNAVSLAFHAMTLLARYPERRFSSTEMAELFDASEHTLGGVMKELVRAGLAGSVRGAAGGFWLVEGMSSATLLDIYRLFEGPLEEQCLLGKPACKGDNCVMGGLVSRLNREARNYLSETTLAELAQTVDLWNGKRTISRRSESEIVCGSGKQRA